MDVTPEYKIELVREMRRRPTLSEARLWQFLRGHRLKGWHFRRQMPMERFVADFCCKEAKVVVEVDGKYHDVPEQKEWDREREAHFTGRGYTVVRVKAEEVMTDVRPFLERLGDILDAVRASAATNSDKGTPLPSAGEGRGEGASD